MPSWMRRARLRLRSLFRGDRVERELDEELRYHLEREIEERLAEGLPPEDARAAARRSVGAVTQQMEGVATCAAWPSSSTGSRTSGLRGASSGNIQVRRDRHCDAGARAGRERRHSELRGRRARQTVAVPQSVAARDRVRDASGPRRKPASGYVWHLNFLDWRARTGAFASIAAYDVRAGFTLSTAAGPERVSGLRVMSGFFTLGGRAATRTRVPVERGGTSRRADGDAHLQRVADTLRRQPGRLGTGRDAAGRTARRDRRPSKRFSFRDGRSGGFLGRDLRGPQACWEVRTCRSLETVARLADGVSVQMANSSDLDAVVQELLAHNGIPFLRR